MNAHAAVRSHLGANVLMLASPVGELVSPELPLVKVYLIVRIASHDWGER